MNRNEVLMDSLPSGDTVRLVSSLRSTATEISVSMALYGLRIALRTNAADVLDRLDDRLPPGWTPHRSARFDRTYAIRVDASDRAHALYRGSRLLARTSDLDQLLDLLAQDLQLYVAERARTHIFLHAGVVGWEGRAIVLPGQSFSGKTTLVAALVRSGAVYYSDEYAVLESRGLVHPFPTPLGLREGEERMVRIPIEELGGRRGRTPLPIGAIVIARYVPGATWRPRTLSLAEAVFELLAHTVSARRRTASALAALVRATAQARVLKGLRGEAEPTARAILQTLRSRRER